MPSAIRTTRCESHYPNQPNFSMLDRAAYEIYFESYIFVNDNTGRRIAETLKRAAMRGVKTHLLVDGFGSSRLLQTMVDGIEAAGAKVLKFRPKISPWTLRRQRVRRLHRKIVVVDQEIAFVGGINIIDDSRRHSPPSTRFDYAVRVEGPLVSIGPQGAPQISTISVCCLPWKRISLWIGAIHGRDGRVRTGRCDRSKALIAVSPSGSNRLWKT